MVHSDYLKYIFFLLVYCIESSPSRYFLSKRIVESVSANRDCASLVFSVGNQGIGDGQTETQRSAGRACICYCFKIIFTYLHSVPPMSCVCIQRCQ